MSVRVKLSTLLQKFTGWQEFVEVPEGSPLECLQVLEARFPDMRPWLYDKNGELRPQIWFFVNGQKIYDEEMHQKLGDGDELQLLLALSGG